MILKLTRFGETEHNKAQGSSVTQAISQTPTATIMNTSEAGEIKGELLQQCFIF